jgi:hypothetical protein
MAATVTPPAPSNAAARPWTCLYRPFRGRRRSNSQPNLNLVSHDSVLVSDEFDSGPATESKPLGRGGPIKKTVRKLMRRASHSFKPSHEKGGPLVVSGPGKKGKGKGRALTGDGESGIVLDEKDVGDSYYCADALAKKIGMVVAFIASCALSLVSRTLTNLYPLRPRLRPSRRDHRPGPVVSGPSESGQLRGRVETVERSGSEPPCVENSVPEGAWTVGIEARKRLEENVYG